VFITQDFGAMGFPDADGKFALLEHADSTDEFLVEGEERTQLTEQPSSTTRSSQQFHQRFVHF